MYRMSLAELIAGVEGHQKELTVFNAEERAVSALRERFHDRNVSVGAEHTPSGRPTSFAVLSDGEEFVAAADVGAVLRPEDGATSGGEDGPRRPIVEHLDETLFTSYDIEQMVSASREIEDRAWRVGSGALHAGFQKLSILGEQMDIYERLAENGSLDVHAYAVPDAEVPDHGDGLTVHVERSDEIGRSWFVAYDGDGVDVNKCALVAEERDPRSFYGFWTYDPATVDWIIDHLESTYGLVETR